MTEIEKRVPESARGDLRSYFEEHPDRLRRLMNSVELIDANRAALRLFGANTQQEVTSGIRARADRSWIGAASAAFASLSVGKAFLETELRGEETEGKQEVLRGSLAVAPGFRKSWRKVFVSVSDITKNVEAPEHLILEITESQLIKDASGTLQFLEDLKKCGIRLSLDDFGTGHSSLSYLQCFDPDILKIDPTFVWGLEKDRGSAALVGGMIVLAQSLGIQVVG